MNNIIAIAFRIAAYRDQIAQAWTILLPLIQSGLKAYPELADLIKKIVPEVQLPKGTMSAAEAVKDGTFSVQWLQWALNKLMGAGLVEDGKYGPATKAAVEAYQAARGLPVDGWAGINTSSSIFKELTHA